MVKVKFTLEQATRPRGGVEVQLYFSFDVSTLWRWVVHASGTLLPPPEKPSTHCTGSWVGWSEWARENLAPTGIWSPVHLAHTKALYWLSFPGLYKVVYGQTHSCTCTCSKNLLFNVVHLPSSDNGGLYCSTLNPLAPNDIYIYIYMQEVPGGMCQTSGGCSLC